MKSEMRNFAERFWFNNQWPAVLHLGKGSNWVDFTFIELYAEYDKFAAALEMKFAILGFCFGASFPVGHTKQNDELHRRVRLVESGLMETFPIEVLEKRLSEEFGKEVKVQVAEPMIEELSERIRPKITKE